MVKAVEPPTALLEQATAARKAGDNAAASALLREYLLHERALLWLAKLSDDPAEALAAAELALHVAPGDEIVQRAIIAVRERAATLPASIADQASIAASIALNTGMTYQEACAVRWPFKQLHRPIGDLLAEGTITLRDLAYGVEHAFDQRVKDAARTVLVTHLVGGEPAQAIRPLQVVQGSRYTEQQERRSLVRSGVAVALGLSLCAVLMIGGIYAWIDKQAVLFSSFLMVVCVPLAYVVLSWFEREQDTAIAYRLGRWGEELALDSLRNLLTDEWTAVRNLVLPQRIGGDIDLVLVGPHGVYAIEVKAYTGMIRNTGDTWERRTKRGWKHLRTAPGQQARRNAAKLQHYLTEQGVALNWVEPVVLWAGDANDPGTPNQLILQNPATKVWRIRNLVDDAEEIHQAQAKLTTAQITAVRTALQQALDEIRLHEQKKRP